MASSSDDGGDSLLYDSDDEQSATYPKPYVVLDQYEVSRQQEKEITSVSTTLSLPTSSATLLLSHYNWNADALFEAWFADEDLVRVTVGLLQKTTDSPEEEQECGICLNIQPCDTMSAAACGHYYCTACWSRYIGASINKGPGCLTLRCPHPSCSVAIDQNMVYKHASSNKRSEYSCYLLQSYVEKRKPLTRFCSSPDCELVIESGNAVHYDVECRCSHQFCLACMEDAHRPLNCRVVAKWVEEGKKNWLPTNPNRCPKCTNIILQPILPLPLPPANCSHMPIGQEKFVSHSLEIQPMPVRRDNFVMPFGMPNSEIPPMPSLSREWDNIGFKKHYYCFGYNSQEGEARRRGSVARFMHHQQQWRNHKNLMIEAQNRLRELEDRGNFARTLHGEKELILKTWMQVVDCRRILSLSYVYGYFLEEQRSTGFETLQNQAESDVIKLIGCMEELETSSAQFCNLVAELESELQVDTMEGTDETDTDWKLCTCLYRSPFQHTIYQI